MTVGELKHCLSKCEIGNNAQVLVWIGTHYVEISSILVQGAGIDENGDWQHESWEPARIRNVLEILAE